MEQTQKRLFSNQMLVRLVLPLMIEQGLAALVGLCDGMMVSSVGEAAISGVSLVDMINGIILTLFAGLATGGAVITSQFLGARKVQDAKNSAGQLVLITGFFGLLSMSLCLIFAQPLMKLFFGSIEADVMAAGLTYLRITALSFPFIALYNAGAAIFRSSGNSKMSMQVSLLMNAINVGGNAFCIFVLKMGVEGVAIPTLISRAVAAAIILWRTSNKRLELHLERQGLIRLDRFLLLRLLRISIPSALENCLFQLGRAVVVSMIALFGTTQTSANAVANNIDLLGVIVGQAFGLAMITVVGHCVGAGDTKQAVYYIKKLLIWGYLAQGTSNVLILLFKENLIGLYSSLSPQTVELAGLLVLIHCGSAILMWPVAFVLPNALRAANDIRFTMLVGIGSMLFWRVGFSWILCVNMGYGAVGVWIAMILDWICRTVFYVGRTLSGAWKHKYIPAEKSSS